MFSRYGFSNHTVGDHSLVEAVYAGRNCIRATLLEEDDALGRWGDTPERKLYRSQLSANFYTVHGRRETIRLSTCIPSEWRVVEPGPFRWDGTQGEQCVLFGMHSNGPEPAELSLSVIGDQLVWWVHNAPVWQAPFVPDHWDDWRIDVLWHHDPARGLLRILRNGVDIHIASPSATLLRPDQANYLKIGLYLWHWPEGVHHRRAYFTI